MLEEQKEIYRQELQRDTTKDFKSEFVRTTNLKRKIVDEFGFEGIKIIFEGRNSANYFQLGDFPPDCPWFSFNNKNIRDFLQSNFNLIEERIPNFLEAMQNRCRFIYSERKDNTWQLHYFMDIQLYDERKYFKIYTGGMPNPNPQPNEELIAFGWEIPKDLDQFYSIHDGFGKDCNRVLGSSEIGIMAQLMNSICEENNYDFPEDYKFENLLEFFPDGVGNGQCFLRKNSDSLNALTVDWDHETWEISDDIDFYEFIDERMSELDEE